MLALGPSAEEDPGQDGHGPDALEGTDGLGEAESPSTEAKTGSHSLAAET